MTLNVELKLGLLITSENLAMSTQASNDGGGRQEKFCHNSLKNKRKSIEKLGSLYLYRLKCFVNIFAARDF